MVCSSDKTKKNFSLRTITVKSFRKAQGYKLFCKTIKNISFALKICEKRIFDEFNLYNKINIFEIEKACKKNKLFLYN